MSSYSILKQGNLGFQLTQIDIKELTFLKYSPCNIFTYFENEFHLSIPKGGEITKEKVKQLILQGHWKFFVSYEDRELLINNHQDSLRKNSRSLSIGDSLVKIRKQTSLLSLNLHYLYQDSSRDDILNLQFQAAKNMAQFLLQNPKIHKHLYDELSAQKWHYTLSQPLLSSVLLLSFLKNTYQFNDREIENLFLASYFKDIGMSSIPDDCYNKKELSKDEKLALNSHPAHSAKILEGRIPLSNTYLDIIGNHHSHSMIGPSYNHSDGTITGIETGLISAMDTISAMTSERPYRTRLTLYDSLEMVRSTMAVQYPQEFKYLIHFFQNFFKK